MDMNNEEGDKALNVSFGCKASCKAIGCDNLPIDFGIWVEWPKSKTIQDGGLGRIFWGWCQIHVAWQIEAYCRGDADEQVEGENIDDLLIDVNEDAPDRCTVCGCSRMQVNLQLQIHNVVTGDINPFRRIDGYCIPHAARVLAYM